MCKRGLISKINDAYKIENSCLKILVIDFNLFMQEIKEHKIDLKLFDNLIRSIYMLMNQQKHLIFVIIKNLEMLNGNQTLMRRYLSDLLYALNNNNQEVENNYQSELDGFSSEMIQSRRPWLLSLAFLHQFKERIFCGFVNFKNYLNERLEMILTKLIQENIVFSHKFENIITFSNLINRI
jgi:hypothetical protein